MRRIFLVGGVVLVTAVTACGDSTAPAPAPALVGGWMSPSESLQPRGSLTRQLGFSEDGSFYSLVNMYGIYPGNTAGQLSAYTRLQGTYEIDGEHVIMTARSEATWDSFNGQDAREVVRNVNYTLFDQARFRIVGPLLILDFISYPADAPVPASLSFVRVMPD